jgi:hypothetical protein
MESRKTNDGDQFSFRRVIWVAAVLVLIGALGELLIWRSWGGAVSLTVAGVVAIINFRWLEVIVHRVVQPGKPRFDRWTALRILGRLALLAIVFAALLMVPRIDAVAVAIGFSTLVLALVIEGLRQARAGGG